MTTIISKTLEGLSDEKNSIGESVEYSNSELAVRINEYNMLERKKYLKY